jgi:zinc transporter ZupT
MDFFSGVILGLAFCHMVPDSAGLAELTEYGGLNGALILLGVMLNLCTERLSIDLAQRKQDLCELKQDAIESREMEAGSEGETESATPAQHRVLEPPGVPVNNTDNIQNTHDMERIQKLKDSKALITAHVVEVGVIVHTVILGISVGTWREGRASLIIFTVAMAFHQFFEGIGLGAIVSAASGISLTKRAAMVAAFALSFPLSICAGIAISYHTSDPTTDELIAGRPAEKGAGAGNDPGCCGVRTGSAAVPR